MKIIGVLAFVLSAFPTFAADIVCERKVSATRSEWTVMDLWPNFRAETVVRECSGNGNFELCFERGQDVIASDNQLCGYSVQQRWECQTREWEDNNGGRYMEVQCPRRGLRAKLQIRPDGNGRLTCFRGNHVERVWRLGTCQ